MNGHSMKSFLEVNPDDYHAEYPVVVSVLAKSNSGSFELIRNAINKAVSDPVLSEVDLQIERLTTAYLGADEPQREQLRQDAKNGWSLLHFAVRMATRALRIKDVATLELAAVALSLENAHNDGRETTVNLAIIRHVAKRIGADWSRIVEMTKAMSSLEMRHFVAVFASREPQSVRIEEFAHRETVDENGPFIEFHPSNSDRGKAKSKQDLSKIYGCGQIVAGEENILDK
jgi:hypothetical protein